MATDPSNGSTLKGVDLTGLLGGIKEDWRSEGWKSPSGVKGRSPGRVSGDEVPQKLKLFFVKLHIIFA